MVNGESINAGTAKHSASKNNNPQDKDAETEDFFFHNSVATTLKDQRQYQNLLPDLLLNIYDLTVWLRVIALLAWYTHWSCG